MLTDSLAQIGLNPSTLGTPLLKFAGEFRGCDLARGADTSRSTSYYDQPLRRFGQDCLLPRWKEPNADVNKT
jgi:hypothetical protein